MVDYVMIFDTKAIPPMKAQIQGRLHNIDCPNVNYSESPYLIFDPIAVSIKTKQAVNNEDQGHVQVMIWVAAHFAQLK